MNLQSCDVVRNSATIGGGIAVNGRVYAYNSIVALNGNKITDGVDVWTADTGSARFMAAGSLIGNIDHKTGKAIYQGGCLTGTTASPMDPGFVDAENADYTLSADSAAIDRGNDLLNSQETDFAGNLRVQGNRIDIGCYELEKGITGTRETASTVVTTGEDIVDAYDGLISLREAIAYAKSRDTITFDSNLFGHGGTIELAGTNLIIDKSLTIDASNLPERVVIDANGLSRAISISDDAMPTVQLTNLKITGGYTKSSSGGGIYVNAWATLSIADCEISGNIASGSYNSYGGGIYSVGTLTVTDSLISENTASYYGGGIYCSSMLTLTGCTISDNSASREGGGVYCSSTLTISESVISGNTISVSVSDSNAHGGGICSFGALTIIDSVISGNTASSSSVYSEAFGGGLYICSTEALAISNCVISGNSASDRGGGIYHLSSGTLTISNSTISGNTVSRSTSDDFGGGICSYRALTVTDSLISENSAYHGGGIYASGNSIITNTQIVKNRVTGGSSGGGIYNEGTMKLTNTAISENIANYAGTSTTTTYGGGIYNNGTLTLTGCTVSGNTASASSSYGGGIYHKSGTLTLYNSIVAGNSAVTSDDIFKNGGSINAYNTLSSYTGWSAASESCYVYDSAKPLFTDAQGSDYTLAADSQAIDVGNNDYVVYPDGSPIESDLAGKARIVGGVVDLGAYEYQGGVSPVEPLDAPANVAATSGGANRHAVSWDAVVNALGYTLAYSTDQTAWQTADAAGVSFVVSGLSYGTTVYYRVKALGDGVSCADSDWSAVVSLAVCPMDVNGDGRINAGDQNLLSINWNKRIGSPDADPRCDINGDGRINSGDQNLLSVNWNKRADAADLTYPEALAAAFVPASAAIDAVFGDAFDSVWEDDEFEFFG